MAGVMSAPLTVPEALAALEAEHARYAEEALVSLDRHRGAVAVLTQALAHATDVEDPPTAHHDVCYTYADLGHMWNRSPDAARKRVDRSTRVLQPVPRRIVNGIACVPRSAIAALLPPAVQAGQRFVRDGR